MNEMNEWMQNHLWHVSVLAQLFVHGARFASAAAAVVAVCMLAMLCYAVDFEWQTVVRHVWHVQQALLLQQSFYFVPYW